MEIGPKTPLPLPTIALPGKGDAALGGLRVGDILQATVMKTGEGTLTLALANRLIEAKSDLLLLQGMSLKVKVEQQAGETVLRILTPLPKSQEQLIAQAMKSDLPRQQPLRPAIEQFQQLARELKTIAREQPQLASSKPLRELQQSVEQLLRHIPTTRQLTRPEALQQVLRNSGLLLEARLGQQAALALSPQQGAAVSTVLSTALQGDLKGNLLRVLAQLIRQLNRLPAGEPTKAPTSKGGQPASESTPQLPLSRQLLQQLTRQGEAALSRLQLNQLQSLPKGEGQEQLWVMELPLFNGEQLEQLRLRIRRERRGERGETGERWSMTLELEDAGQAPLQITVSLSDGQIATTFRAAREETAQLFQEHLATLQARLQEQGLQVGRLQSHRGIPSEAGPTAPHTGTSLLSEKA